MLYRLILVFAVVLSSMITLVAQNKLSWKLGPSMSQPRSYHGLVRIDDSTALAVGGWYTGAFGQTTNSCDVIAATKDGIHVSATLPMSKARAEFPCYVMGDTAVVVFGGVTTNDKVLKEVEVFDIRTRTWRTSGQLLVGRRQHVAYPIGDSRFLVVGGRQANLETLSSAEIFDVATGQSQLISSFPVPINGAIGTVTSTGKGVVFGGRDGGPSSGRINGVLSYDESSQRWLSVGTLTDGREAPMSFRLRDGRVVIVGGAFDESPLQLSTEVVVESNNVFNVITNKVEGRLYCALAEYHDGEIVIAGGQDITEGPIARTQFVDVASGVVTDGPDLNFARYRTRGISLRYSGSTSGFETTVVIVGGDGAGAAALNSTEYLEGTCTGSSDLLSTNSMLTAVGSARLSPSMDGVLLTAPLAFSAGAVWYKGKLGVANGLSTSFSFKLSQGSDNGQPDGGSQGADGVALVIQNSSPSPLGKPGQGIGYEGIPNAVAVEFDSYLNAAYSDPAGNHVAVQSSKHTAIKPWHRIPYLLGMTYNIPMLKSDGTVYYAKVDFKGDGIDVFLSTTPVFGAPVLSIPNQNLASLIQLDPQGAAWIGITSATGFSVQQHEILAWSIGGCQPLITAIGDESANTENFPAQARQPVIVPMPSSDNAVLSYSSEEDAATISIYNTNGMCVWSGDLTGSELTLGVQLPAFELSAGVYVVKVVSGGSHRAVKWIIQH